MPKITHPVGRPRPRPGKSPMNKILTLAPLLVLAAITVLFAALPSVAHAQTPPTTPTVSTVAVTSNPGTDNTYTTLDVITVTVTFSEAVTATGTPQITLDIGGTQRTAGYAGAGTTTSRLLFSYEVQPVDQDDDGIAVVVNSLALNGGTIQSTDDSTDATLTHAAQAAANHKVDTEITLVSNLGQADGTPLRISATEAVRIDLNPLFANSFALREFVLDVKTPSDTLEVSVELEASEPNNPSTIYQFTGSATTAGLQTFKLATSNDVRLLHFDSIAPLHRLIIKGSGGGYVELETTASVAEDDDGIYGWSLTFPHFSTDGGQTYVEQTPELFPRIGAVGHIKQVLRIESTIITSSPYNGTAYAVGETIEVSVELNGPVRILADALSVPLLIGNGPGSRRRADLLLVDSDYRLIGLWRNVTLINSTLRFAYTVQAGDVDSEGVVLASDPLGAEADAKIAFPLHSAVRQDLSAPAFEGGSGQQVDGSQPFTCDAIYCAHLDVSHFTVRSNTPNVYGYSGSGLDETGDGALSRFSFGYAGKDQPVINLYHLRVPSILRLRVEDYFAQRALDRLALDLDGTQLAFADADSYSLLPQPGHFPELVHELDWSNPGITWNDGDRILVKIVELPVTATFDAPTYAKDEGDSFDVTVALGGAFEDKTVTLPLVAADQDGATSADFSGVPSELVFMPGETEKTFTVSLTQDTLDDDDESIALSFGTLPDTVKSGGDNETATVTLRDDDDPEVDVEFGAATYSAGEGASATVEITLSANPERTVIIPLTKTEQGGISAADYSGVPASVTFNTGETSKTFTFSAVQDDVDDDDESVKLSFGTLPARVSEGTQDETTISIADDDDPHVTVEFGAATYSAGEGGSATVRITLSADPERTVVIPLVKTDQGGISTADYSGVPASITFNSAERAKTFTFSATHDDLDDDDESVKLSFGAMPDARVSPGTTDEVTLSIADDDNPHVTVQFTQAEYTVVEGSNVGVRITLSADPERTVSIPIPAANQDGATSADYTVPASVTFDAGEKEKTVTFAARDDDLDDFGESVKLSFGTTLPDRITRGGTQETKINIWQFTALDCSAALLCANVSLADRTALDWAWYGIIYQVNSDPASSIDDDDFRFGGLDYTIHHIGIVPGIFPEMDNPWSRSHQHEARLWIDIGHGDARTIPSRDHYRDWTLYIDDVTLPLSQAHRGGLNAFLWDGAGIQNLFADWTPSTINRIGIMETPFADQPQAVVPGVPGLASAHGFGGDTISVRWWTPHSDGGSAITGYKVQWKEAGDRWTDGAAVSEMPEDSRNALAGRATIRGVTRGTLYTVRVIATNAVGDSQPSAEMATRPKGAFVRVTESAVNGATLTLRYDRNMDSGSVPATGSFVVIVSGGIRTVDSVSISGMEVRLTLSSAVSAVGSWDSRTPPTRRPARRCSP